MIKQYRKKPVIIQAIRWDGTSIVMQQAQNLAGTKLRLWHDRDNNLLIPTREGTMIAYPGDWIIQGIKGEVYPCAPDIFEKTYEEVVS